MTTSSSAQIVPPHTYDNKIECGCAGCFTAPIAPLVLATVFESVGQLGYLPKFSNIYGGEFYGLPATSSYFEIEKYEPRQVVAARRIWYSPNGYYPVWQPPMPLTWRIVAAQFSDACYN